MVINFRVREVSQGTRTLAWTPILIKKRKKKKKVSVTLILDQRDANCNHLGGG
jgi:hypothetical protein